MPITNLLITLLSLGWLHFTATLKVADRLAGRGTNHITSEETCEGYLRSYYASCLFAALIKLGFQMTVLVCTCLQM